MRLDLQAKLLRVIEETECPADRRFERYPDRCHDNRTYEIETSRRRWGRGSSGGPVLPAERLSLHLPAAAGAQRRYFRCWPATFSRLIRGSTKRCRSGRSSPESGGVAGRLPLAGEHPGTPERHRSGSFVLEKRRDRLGRSTCPRRSCTSRAGRGEAGPRANDPDTGLSLEEVEKNLIVQAIQKAGQNKTLAAKLLGIHLRLPAVTR